MYKNLFVVTSDLQTYLQLWLFYSISTRNDFSSFFYWHSEPWWCWKNCGVGPN